MDEILEKLEDVVKDDRFWAGGVSHVRAAFFNTVAILKELWYWRKRELPEYAKMYILEKIRLVEKCIGGKEVD